MSINDLSISVVIPTFNRGAVLLATVEMLLNQVHRADEIIIVDQTDYERNNACLNKLNILHDQKKVLFIRLSKPSIPAAMNVGLNSASSDNVLFLDDDIKIDHDFIKQHKECLAKSYESPAHIGQIIQPWQVEEELDPNYKNGVGFLRDIQFPFNSKSTCEIYNASAGNMCVSKKKAILAGGFDENFVGAAYRFETEFAKRLARVNKSALMFYPEPRVFHLKVERGGTRETANFLTTTKPDHSAGDYYFALLEGEGFQKWSYIAKRLFTCFIARFYLQKPQFIPVRIYSELRGLFQALRLMAKGPKLIDVKNDFGVSNEP